MKIRFKDTLSFDNCNGYTVVAGTVCKAEKYDDNRIAILLPNKHTALAPITAVGKEIEIIEE